MTQRRTYIKIHSHSCYQSSSFSNKLGYSPHLSDSQREKFERDPVILRSRQDEHGNSLYLVDNHSQNAKRNDERSRKEVRRGCALFGGNFILSLEKPERCDPSNNPLSYKAVACLSKVLSSAWNHKTGKCGLGEHGEERWHVTRFESLCREVRRREFLVHPEDGIPSWAPSLEFGQNMIADNRRIPAYPGKFNVDSPYQFGLELWKATQLFDDRQTHGAQFMPSVPPSVKLPESLIEGPDRQSLYLPSAARNFRGETPWGKTAQISADDARGITLHEMTQRVSAMLTPKYQANRALKKQEQLARKNENRLGEFDGQRPGDG